MQGLLSARNGSNGYFSSLRSDEYFPDPFCDMASTAMPETIGDALRWAEFIWMSNGIYRQAMERVLSYFLTKITFTNTEADRVEKSDFKEYLEEDLDIYARLREVASDYLCYGNAFVSLLPSFTRSLSCPNDHGNKKDGKKPCGHEAPLRVVFNTPEYKFKWKDFDFHATCPSCGYSGKWNHVDRRGGEESSMRVKRWSPHEIELLHDPLTDDCQYVWKIPAEYRKQIKEGTSLFVLERANWEVVQAIKSNNHFLFDPGAVFHMRDSAISGVKARSWGIPRIITNFRQAWYVQVLQRYNEAIALDYVIPFRVITPMPKGGGTGESADPLLSINMGDFSSQVLSMIKKRNRNPSQWNVFPFPLQYQALGGEASEMAPYQLIELGRNDLLNSLGVPKELFETSLTMQSAPTATRLFQSLWTPLVHNLNNFLAWLGRSIAEYFGWEPMAIKLAPVTTADSVDKQMAKLQLMMGRQISQQTGLDSLDLDFEEEQKKMLQEEKLVAEESEKLKKEMSGKQQQQQLGAQAGMPQDPAQGGDPNAQAAGGAGGAPVGPTPPPDSMPNTPIDPTELLAQADEIAQELLSMPPTQMRSELIALKKQNETLHSVVKSRIESIRQQAQTAGGAQVLAQQFGGGAGKTAAQVWQGGLSTALRRRGFE